jgi:ABC-type branched-subunit amino acid transport system substrate-binding protein
MRLLVTLLALAVAFAAVPDAAAQGPIKIGFLAPLTGAIAQAGKDMYSGCELLGGERLADGRAQARGHPRG